MLKAVFTSAFIALVCSPIYNKVLSVAGMLGENAMSCSALPEQRLSSNC